MLITQDVLDEIYNLQGEYDARNRRNEWQVKMVNDLIKQIEASISPSLPYGWRKTLAGNISHDIVMAMILDGVDISSYQPESIYVKEKYGRFDWYDSVHSPCKSLIPEIYEYISKHTCIICGKFGVPLFDDDWVSPFCHNCYKEFQEDYWKQEITAEKIEKAIFQPFFRDETKAGHSREKHDMSDKMDEFYDAWTFLADHPIFIRDDDLEKEPNYFHFQRNLGIEVVKVNPETNEIDDDQSLNTKTAVWLECGTEENHHDIDLDSGGDSFEDAVIELAKLVREKYGDIPAQDDGETDG